jgi:hypothetical protein
VPTRFGVVLKGDEPCEGDEVRPSELQGMPMVISSALSAREEEVEEVEEESDVVEEEKEAEKSWKEGEVEVRR